MEKNLKQVIKYQYNRTPSNKNYIFKRIYKDGMVGYHFLALFLFDITNNNWDYFKNQGFKIEKKFKNKVLVSKHINLSQETMDILTKINLDKKHDGNENIQCIIKTNYK